MIRSMTGFGEASAQIDGVHYFIEARSLNGKYFKAVIRLPEQFQSLEAEMESRLRHRVTRGTVSVQGSVSDASESAAGEINVRALERYIEQIRRTPMVENGTVTIDAGSLLALPGVVQPPRNEERRLAAARAAFLDLLDRACAGLEAMRRTEGRALADELVRLLDGLADRLRAIAERAPAVSVEYEKRLRQRIDTLLAETGVKAEAVDIIREIAAYAERADVHEELARLRAHLDQFRDLLAADEGRPVGRTLDFLAQEMLREANTIASKSPDAAISRATIEVKGAIDRIKELVQNVE